jgi:isoleucyl-tRNA synthetase
VRSEVARALEGARAAKWIGASLDARVTLFATGSDVAGVLDRAGEALLRDLFIVSEVVRRAEPPPSAPGEAAVLLGATGVAGLSVEVRHAAGAKCARCWMWSEAVGRDAEHPELCGRCLPVVRARLANQP